MHSNRFITIELKTRNDRYSNSQHIGLDALSFMCLSDAQSDAGNNEKNL